MKKRKRLTEGKTPMFLNRHGPLTAIKERLDDIKEDLGDVRVQLNDIKNDTGNIYTTVSAMAVDQRLDRMEQLLNAMAADIRVGRYCAFRGSDLAKGK